MRALTCAVLGANLALLAGNVIAWRHLARLRRRWKAAMRWWARDDVRRIAERESEHPGIAYTERNHADGRCPLYVPLYGNPMTGLSDYRCGLAVAHPGSCIRFGDAVFRTHQWWLHDEPRERDEQTGDTLPASSFGLAGDEIARRRMREGGPFA